MLREDIAKQTFRPMTVYRERHEASFRPAISLILRPITGTANAAPSRLSRNNRLG